MREIRFRVWNKEKQKFVGVDDKSILLSEYGSLRTIDRWGNLGSVNKESYKLNFFTGLKDKNGKEIYEGDIIEMQHCKKCNGLKAIVKRYWDGWWYFTEEETKGRMGEMVSQYVANFDEKFEKLSYCIIIGNKYEDPELLGGE